MHTRSLALLTLAAVTLSSFDADAARRRRRPAKKPVIPSVLRGSEDSLARENRMADAAGLPRLKDRTELETAIADGTLVPIEDTDAFVIDGELGEEDPDHAELYAYARPTTKVFLDDLLGEAHRRFGHRFAVTSLVRTDEYQSVLRASNRSAASGKTLDERSTHLTGATVDITLVGVPWKPKQWLRKRLIELEKRGLIQATEERRQYCFHVLVLPAYGDAIHPPESQGSVR
jgi:hypothetical protein